MGKAEEIFFEVYESEFYEFLADSHRTLRKENEEYIKLIEKKEKILEENSKIRNVIEDDMEIPLSKKDVIAFNKLRTIEGQMRKIEDKDIFFVGGREMYKYLKRIDALK